MAWGGAIIDSATGEILPTKRAFATVAANTTDSSLVAAGSRRLRAIYAVVIVSAAMNVTFNSKGAGAGTAVTPLWPLQATAAGFVLSLNEHGWFATNTAEALTVTTGAGGSASILVGYVEVT